MVTLYWSSRHLQWVILSLTESNLKRKFWKSVPIIVGRLLPNTFYQLKFQGLLLLVIESNTLSGSMISLISDEVTNTESNFPYLVYVSAYRVTNEVQIHNYIWFYGSTRLRLMFVTGDTTKGNFSTITVLESKPKPRSSDELMFLSQKCIFIKNRSTIRQIIILTQIFLHNGKWKIANYIVSFEAFILTRDIYLPVGH